MYIRKTKRLYKGKIYTNHLLVESVLTPKGPRQRVLCSLGRLEPAPREQWLALAHRMEAALRGQLALPGQEAETKTRSVGDVRVGRGRRDQKGFAGRVGSLPLIRTGLKRSSTVRPGQCTWGIRSGSSWVWRRSWVVRGCRRRHGY